MKIQKFILLFLFFCALIRASPLFAEKNDAMTARSIFIKEKFQNARPGDYIITAQEKNYSLLRVRSIRGNVLILEEVCVPAHQIDLKKIDWREWLQKKAPGHTAWTLYEIDMHKGQLLDGFSYSKNGWLSLDGQEQFFAHLFKLRFESTPDGEKKRIGPPPPSGEADHRKFWYPFLFFQGKKKEHPLFETFRAQWPEDGSELSRCKIDLYLDATSDALAFPYWVEIKSAHISFTIRTIDSGRNLPSPLREGIPRRPVINTLFPR